MIELAESLDRRFMVRLVKGAYWDTEMKRTQERGLDDYPLFTARRRRPFLSGLSRQALESAAAHLPAVRQPQTH